MAANIIRLVSVFLFVCFSTSVTIAQAPHGTADTKHWKDIFTAVAEKNQPKLMVGDLEGYVAAIRSAVKADDWVSQLVAGDAVYGVSPAAAISFHEAASKLAPEQGMPHLELAFDYQRTGRCDLAIPAWEAADRLRVLRSPATAVAAYCFFRVGRVDEALALWSRVRWPENRVSLDFALSEMVIGTRALDVHVETYALARAGDESALSTLIGNALDWRVDWWNASAHPQAFDAVRELARNVRPSDASLRRELECANEAISAKGADSLRDVLRRCNLLIEDGKWPVSSAVGKFLLARLDAVKAAPVGDLLLRHAAELEGRSRSERGDLAALEVLAFLQVRAGDQNGLTRSNELGWRRYRVAKFAKSRLVSARSDKNEWAAGGEALLQDALRDFPNEAFLHVLRYEALPPTPSGREQMFMGWLFAEYAGLSSPILGIGPPTSTTLASLVFTLRKMREARLERPQ